MWNPTVKKKKKKKTIPRSKPYCSDYKNLLFIIHCSNHCSSSTVIGFPAAAPLPSAASQRQTHHREDLQISPPIHADLLPPTQTSGNHQIDTARDHQWISGFNSTKPPATATHNTHHNQHRFGFIAAKAAPPPVSSSTPITAIDRKPTPSYCLQQPAAPQPP